MAENFPNLTDINLQIQEAEQAPNKKQFRGPMPVCPAPKLRKTKDQAKILKSGRDK